jgi:hypothetical protein
MDLKKFHVPNYYKDKKGREYATNYLENLSYGALRSILIDKDIEQCLRQIAKLVDIRFKPKFLDDTVFVVVSRLHPAITAVRFIRQYHFKELTVPQQYIILKFVEYLDETYIPFCRKLQKNIFHRFSNHGAIGIMGESIAQQLFMDISVYKTTEETKKQLLKLRKKVNRHIEFVIKKNGEIWVENLRNKKGLYYTYLHLAAILRAKMVLEGLFFNEHVNLPKADLKFATAIVKYLEYYIAPEIWPYMEPTKIPILRQLQKLIFPSDKFIAPRPDGKEGAFVDFINKVILQYDIPFAPQDVYFEVEGPIPFSSYFAEHFEALI